MPFETETLSPIPFLAELREEVLKHSLKRMPKWKFRFAPDVVVQLQPKPTMLLSAGRDCARAQAEAELLRRRGRDGRGGYRRGAQALAEKSLSTLLENRIPALLLRSRCGLDLHPHQRVLASRRRSSGGSKFRSTRSRKISRWIFYRRNAGRDAVLPPLDLRQGAYRSCLDGKMDWARMLGQRLHKYSAHLQS